MWLIDTTQNKTNKQHYIIIITTQPEFEVKPIEPVGKFLRRTDWQKQEDERDRLYGQPDDDDQEEAVPKDKAKKFTVLLYDICCCVTYADLILSFSNTDFCFYPSLFILIFVFCVSEHKSDSSNYICVCMIMFIIF
jgi:hypothetical protein